MISSSTLLIVLNCNIIVFTVLLFRLSCVLLDLADCCEWKCPLNRVAYHILSFLQVEIAAVLWHCSVWKSSPRFTKSSSMVLLDLVLTKIQPFKNVKLNKEMFGHPDTASGWPYISLLILTFSIGFILLTIGSIYTKLGDFVKLGLHFLWLCGSIVANPIIDRFAPSPFWLEITEAMRCHPLSHQVRFILMGF